MNNTFAARSVELAQHLGGGNPYGPGNQSGLTLGYRYITIVQ
jgi:hypothetical protein